MKRDPACTRNEPVALGECAVGGVAQAMEACSSTSGGASLAGSGGCSSGGGGPGRQRRRAPPPPPLALAAAALCLVAWWWPAGAAAKADGFCYQFGSGGWDLLYWGEEPRLPPTYDAGAGRGIPICNTGFGGVVFRWRTPQGLFLIPSPQCPGGWTGVCVSGGAGGGGGEGGERERLPRLARAAPTAPPQPPQPPTHPPPTPLYRCRRLCCRPPERHLSRAGARERL